MSVQTATSGTAPAPTAPPPPPQLHPLAVRVPMQTAVPVTYVISGLAFLVLDVFAVFGVLQLVQVGSMWGWLMGSFHYYAASIAMGVIVAFACIAKPFFDGREWARVAYMVYGGLVIVSVGVALVLGAASDIAALAILIEVMAVVGIVCALLPPSNRYVRRAGEPGASHPGR